MVQQRTALSPQVTKNIVRVGSRSKTPELAEYNLKTLYRNQRFQRQMQGRHDAFEAVNTLKDKLMACVVLLKEAASPDCSKGVSATLRAELTPDVFRNVVDSFQQDVFMDGADANFTSDEDLAAKLDQWLPTTPADASASPSTSSDDLKVLSAEEILASLGVPARKSGFKRSEWGMERNTGGANGDGDGDFRQESDEALDKVVSKVRQVVPLRFPRAAEGIPTPPATIALDQWMMTIVNLWDMSPPDRARLAKVWLLPLLGERRARLLREYRMAAEDCGELRQSMQLEVLRKSDIVGMTTTGAARNQNILASLRPSIVIVEEAAEIMEAPLSTLYCLFSTLCSLLTALCSLLSALCALHSAFCILLSALCSLHSSSSLGAAHRLSPRDRRASRAHR
jgi:hypothetical protein